jgi:hypothetical protein
MPVLVVIVILKDCKDVKIKFLEGCGPLSHSRSTVFESWSRTVYPV